MPRYGVHRVAAFSCVIALVGSTAESAGGACSLLTPADITKATGLKVADGTTGQAVPGVLGKCTWTGTGDTKVIVTLTDAQHMQITVAAQLKNGGTAISGVGSKAVASRGAGFTGGGYILSVLDANGGFGVSVLGKDGTQDRVVALAKVVEGRR